MPTCPAQRLDLRRDGPQGLLGGVGVDVVPVGASLAVALDAPAEEVEALVDVGDQSLLRRQAQAHRGQDPGDLLPQGFGVAPGAVTPSGTSRPRTGSAGSWAGRGAAAWPARPAGPRARLGPGRCARPGPRGRRCSAAGRGSPPAGCRCRCLRSTRSSPRMPALRNAFTSARTRLSPIRRRTRSIRAAWSISSNEAPPYYPCRGLAVVGDDYSVTAPVRGQIAAGAGRYAQARRRGVAAGVARWQQVAGPGRVDRR